MDHTQAAENQSAERYLLGELPAGDAEDFERHYFDCPECAEAVEAGGAFLANTRAVLSEKGFQRRREPILVEALRNAGSPRVRRWGSWQVLVPVAAAFALAAVALYQGMVLIPGMRQAFDSPRALAAFQLTGVSRGTGNPIRVPAGTRSLALSIDVPPDAHFPQFLCVLTSGDRTQFRVTAEAPPEGQPITVLVPTRELTSGDYQFAVYGSDASGKQQEPVARSSFHFEIH